MADTELDVWIHTDCLTSIDQLRKVLVLRGLCIVTVAERELLAVVRSEIVQWMDDKPSGDCMNSIAEELQRKP